MDLSICSPRNHRRSSRTALVHAVGCLLSPCLLLRTTWMCSPPVRLPLKGVHDRLPQCFLGALVLARSSLSLVLLGPLTHLSSDQASFLLGLRGSQSSLRACTKRLEHLGDQGRHFVSVLQFRRKPLHQSVSVVHVCLDTLGCWTGAS